MSAPIDLATQLVLLRSEQRSIEAVTFRLHILCLTLAGTYPGRLDDADLGLTDAIDRLRHEELQRVIACVTDTLDPYWDGTDPLKRATSLTRLGDGADAGASEALQTAVDDLGSALDALANAAATLRPFLDDASYRNAPSGRPVNGALSSSRLAMLRRLVDRAIPETLSALVRSAHA